MAPRTTGGSLTRLSLPAKIVFGVILMTIVGALYFVVFFTDIDGQISTAVAAEQQLKGELQKVEDARTAYQKDVEDRARRQQIEREQKKVLPDEAETPSFLSSMQNIATTSGVTLSSYRPEDESVDEYFVRVPMSLAITGRFHQIARFMYGVGKLDRVINIEDIQMTVLPQEKEDSDIILDVKCLATAFRAKRADEGSKGGKK